MTDSEAIEKARQTLKDRKLAYFQIQGCSDGSIGFCFFTEYHDGEEDMVAWADGWSISEAIERSIAQLK